MKSFNIMKPKPEHTNIIVRHSVNWILLTFTMLLIYPVTGQILDFQNTFTISLDDGIAVRVFGKANRLSNEFTGEYYYLPTNLRLSTRDDNTPEFLFLKYTTEDKAESGGVQGALMHFLMEWGLTPEQIEEVELKLAEKVKDLAKSSSGSSFAKVSNPKLMGPVNLLSSTEDSFRIISATLNSDQFTPNYSVSGSASLVPGAKMAVGALLEKNGAQLLATTLEKNRSITDVSINLSFRYEVLTPKVNGRITVDWTKFDSVYEYIGRSYTHSDIDDGTLPGGNSLRDDIISDNEEQTFNNFLTENNIVKVELDIGEVDNPIAQKVVEVFMEYFLKSITDKEFTDIERGGNKEEEKEPYKPDKNLHRYHMSETKIKTKSARKTEIYDLNVRLPMVQEITITENLASWYDGVKHNPQCVSAVNLNDPFFQHRDIHFILDLDARDMFAEEVNYVTINTRKKRTDGRDFYDRITIDNNYVQQHGVNATMTYARGNDTNPDAYEFQAQWSLRGGKVFPESPVWQTGNWEGVSLKPPVIPRLIEFQSDLEALNSLDIIRTTLQIRYKKFDEEVEANIHLSPVENQPLKSKTLYMDRDTQGYVYRLIFNHKTEGKLALPWSSKVNDNFVYAIIPDELNDKNSKVFTKAKEAAKEIFKESKPNGTVSNDHKVLDRFKEIIGVVLENN